MKTLFIVTHDRHGQRQLLLQRGYASEIEARGNFEAFLANNSKATIEQIFGTEVEKTVKIFPAPCNDDGKPVSEVYPMSREVVVRWTAVYETTIEIPLDAPLDGQEVKDAAACIDVDVRGSEYQMDTWEVEKIFEKTS
jgi:hypothetical protein